MQSNRDQDTNLDPRLASELQHWAAQEKMQNLDRIAVQVDRSAFIATRNALTNAFVGLSGAIDEAVKAYVNHTNAVLDGVGGQTLDVSGLMQPILGISQLSNAAALAHQALQGGNGVFPPGVLLNPDGTKKKRQYKPRDPNAPKRPLTAYFRYLQEQRPIIQAELSALGPEAGKAGDISKIATDRWNALPKEQQQPYRKAYEKEMHKYYADVKEYKGAGGQVDDEDAEAAAVLSLPAVDAPATAAADESSDDEDDEDDESDSGAESSDESDEDEPEPTPPPPPVPVKQKTPKASQKKAKAGADPVAPVQQFSSINPTPVVPPAAAVASSSPTRKRKADKEAVVEGGKKRTKKTKAQKEAEDNAAAAAQLREEEPVAAVTEQPKKEKKKKRKSEPTA